jgi:2-dehydropantoate 2-reductase
MKVLLVGAGAVGGTAAVLFKEGGFDLDILEINEERAKDIRDNGIFLTGAKGSHNAKFTAYSSPDSLTEKYDIIIIAVKSTALVPAANSVKNKLKDNGLAVAMENGLCAETLAEIFGSDRTVGVMIGFGATLLSPEHVEMTSKGEFYIGLINGSLPPKIYYLRDMYNAVLPTEITCDIKARLWSKLIINTCINSVAAITGETLGIILDSEKGRKLFLAIAKEGFATSKALGLKVPPYGKILDYRLLALDSNTVFDKIIQAVIKAFGKTSYAKVKPSTLQSLERGEKTEVDIFNGYIDKKGRESGIPTPVNGLMTKMIKEIEDGKRKISPSNIDEFSGMI